MPRKKIVRTCNTELYNKLHALNFTDEIVLNKVKPREIGKIIRNINKNKKILVKETIGERILLKKVKPGPLNINVYFK